MNDVNLIGVLDLKGGVAVRAVGGRRDEYRPMRSRLCGSADPRRIAKAYRDRYGVTRLYVADLDALTGAGRNDSQIAELAADGFEVAADCGVRTPEAAAAVFGLGVQTVVVALETLPGPAALDGFVGRFGAERLAFSLDLADGVPLADPVAWGVAAWDIGSPERLAVRAVAAGFRRLVVLDLKSVGTAAGPTTAGLCARLAAACPGVSLWTGGGVRTAADAQMLSDAGADGVLAASALHDGTL